MKTNIIKTLLLCGLAVSATSCNDFLDQSSDSEHTPSNVWNSPYYSSLVLNKAYGALTEDGTYAQVMAFTTSLNTDIELVDAGDAASYTAQGSERSYMNYNAVAGGWNKAQTAWDNLYTAIEYCNNVIDGLNGSSLIEGTSAESRQVQRYKGEALTLRAMLYFDLIRNYGDVPLKLAETKTDLSNVYLEKTDRDEIMDALIGTLEEAVELLPWAGENSYTTEHVTKGYAHALLAHMALQRAGWAIREHAKDGYETAAENSDPTYPTQRPGAAERQKYYQLALSHLNAVISSGVHQLNPSIADQWYLVNQRELDSKYNENIFEVPMGLNKSGEFGYTVGVRISGASSKYGPKGNSSGKVKLTAPFFWSFDRKDLRRDLTCATYELKEENGVLKENMQKNVPFGIYVAKWDIRKMNEEWRQAALGSTEKVPTGINTIKMRYPQVLLMYAEVLNELNGNPDDATGGAGLTARQALEMVHTRAFAEADKADAKAYVDALPADKNAFFEAVVQENAWEFAGEGVRKFELERWNLLSKKIDEFKETFRYQMENVYPKELYYKVIKEGNEEKIDMSSVCWYEEPDEDIKANYQKNGYSKVAWWGTPSTDTNPGKNPIVALDYISGGLNSTVKNRYLMPISTSTIADAQGKIANSYGY